MLITILVVNIEDLLVETCLQCLSSAVLVVSIEDLFVETCTQCINSTVLVVNICRRSLSRDMFTDISYTILVVKIKDLFLETVYGCYSSCCQYRISLCGIMLIVCLLQYWWST